MIDTTFLSAYLVMVFFLILYTFDEIRLETYQEAGPLNQYLLGASFLVFIYFLPLFLLQLGFQWGYYVGFLPALLAIGNGIARVISISRNKSFQGSKLISIINGIFLSITGIWGIMGILSTFSG